MAWLNLFKVVFNSVPTEAPISSVKSSNEELVKAQAAYSALVTKRSTYDLMLWQAPMITLTAQAFLLQIAFGNGNLIGPKVICGFAASIIGFASWLLFIRHSALERQSSRKLRSIESMYNFPVKAHGRPDREKTFVAGLPGKPVWCVCLYFVSYIGLLPALEPELKNYFPYYWTQ